MSNPLTLLRQWIKNNFDDIKIDENEQIIRCNDETIEFSASSNFVSNNTTLLMSAIVPVLVIILSKEDQGYAKYILEAKKKGLQNITFKDFKELRQYLTGETATLAGLQEAPAEAPKEVAPAPSAIPEHVQPEQKPAETQQEQKQAQPEEQPQQPQQPRNAAYYPPRSQYISEETLKDKIHQDFQERVLHAGTQEEVEYELLRPIDIVLTVNTADFSDMVREENDILAPHKRAPTTYTSGDSSLIETHTERNFKYPIIIVPQTDESAINNSNIAKFLTDGIWEEPNENGPDVQHIRHLHTVKGKTLDFDIVAVTTKLKEEDWNHVVAIFLCGKKWQLRNIPGKDPSQIFKRFTGIYVNFDNQRPNDDVSKWNVKTFNISHTNRFLDSQVSTKIWQEIETVISLKKERKSKY